MPEIAGQELSKTDLGITTTEVCPECSSTEIDIEPASYENGKRVGVMFRCLDCGWYETFEEDSPKDAEKNHKRIEQDLILIPALVGWLEGFRENAVEELRDTSALDKADQRHLQSEIETLGKLIDFFDQGGEQ